MTKNLRIAFFMLGLAISVALFFAGASYTHTVSVITHNHNISLKELHLLESQIQAIIKALHLSGHK